MLNQYKGRPRASVPTSLTLSREAASYLRQLAGPRSLGQVVSRLVLEERARAEERQRSAPQPPLARRDATGDTPTITAVIDNLRSQGLAAKGLTCIVDLARDMDLTRNTLAAFLRGEYVGLASLLAIEAWLERQGKGK